MLEGFNQSTEFVTAILDLEGNVLSKSGWRQVCTQFHRINPESSKNCALSDTVLANELGNGEKYHFYKCLNGLVDVAVPIIIKGEHIANLFSGQFFFEEPDFDYFRKQAEKFAYNQQEYIQALADVPVLSKERVKIAMDFLLNMTQLISNMAYQKLDQERLNEALLKSEERLRSAFDQMLEGCQIIGHDWKYIYLNRSAEVHNRRPNKDLLGKTYQEMWPGIEQTELYKVIDTVLKDKISRQFENEFVFPDGELGWFNLNIQSIQEGALILSIDITERKKAEEALRESEEKYRLISDNAGDWIYWKTAKGEMKYVSPACERITGYSPEEFTINPDLLQDIVHDADQEILRKHAQIPPLDDSCHNLEFRIKGKNGETTWINHSCRPILNKSGEFLGRRGTNRDITAQKLKEEQLFESEFRFARLFENGPFGMVIADKNFRFQRVNHAFCNIMQYSEQELLQFTFKEISHPEDLAKDLVKVQQLMNKEISVYKTDKRYIRRDGVIIWGSLTLTATFNSEGQFLYNLGIIEDISERKRNEEEIRQLNERISTATHASKVGIWDWDVQNNVLKWDDQMYLLYGLSKSEFAGAYEAWVYGLHPEDKGFSMEQTNLALRGEKEYDTEFRVVWPDGAIHFIAAKGEVFRNEQGAPVRMVGINFDITEQKKKDEKIREKDKEFRKLSANVPDLIFQFTRKPDGSYCVPIASEGIINIFGCKPEDVIDDFSPIGRVIYPEDAERVIRDIEDSAKHLTYFTCEFRVHIPGREVQWIYSKSTPERLPDGSITWYGFNTDITEKKLAEEVLRESEEKYRKLNETLEERVAERTTQLKAANVELEAFSYSVSHDLRAPLRHLNGYVELLNERYSEDLPEKARHYLSTISNSAKQMGTLIDDLLQFSRTGRKELSRVKLDMNVLVEEVLEKIKPDLENRKIIWTVQQLPILLGDYSLLKQVWINLLDNAVKYTRYKELTEITIGFKQEKTHFVFFVRDNGVGFDMKYSNKLFGVFQRLHSQTEFEGTGIGLANVQRIIYKHSGQVWAEAELGLGATFFFSLPKNTMK